jgi:hypothetical protein
MYLLLCMLVILGTRERKKTDRSGDSGSVRAGLDWWCLDWRDEVTRECRELYIAMLVRRCESCRLILYYVILGSQIGLVYSTHSTNVKLNK